MLVLDNLDYTSERALLFMRVSVLLSEAFLIFGLWFLSKSIKTKDATILAVLILCNPGLLLVDNVHFQYNAMLYGIQFFGIACFFRVDL